MNQTITLPRAAVEQAIAALKSDEEMATAFYLEISALRAALEQPQNHVPDAGNMAPAGWKPVPVVPTEEMLDAGRNACEGRFYPQDMLHGPRAMMADRWVAMLAAAPQPPTTEDCSVVQQQVEQEPVAEVHFVLPQYHDAKRIPTKTVHLRVDVPVGTKLHTNPQPPRQPLTDEETRRIYNAATYHASLAVFMTRMDAEDPDADDKGVSGWLQEAEDRVKHRAIERAHGIGGEA